MSIVQLTIIIPVFNEINTIEKVVHKVSQIKLNKQIIIVDDFSKDGSRELLKVIKDKNIKVIFHEKNHGKGACIISAKKYVEGEYVIIQDADLEYNPDDIIKLYNEAKTNNYSAVYGSRVLNKNKYENLENFSHRIRIYGNAFLTILSNIINNQKLTDAHTCYKLFKSEIFKNINLREKGFSFCPEITTKLSLIKVKIKEIPISYQGRTYEEGKKIVAKDGLSAILTLLKYRFLKK